MEKAMTELKRTPEEVNGMTEEQLRAALRKIKWTQSKRPDVQCCS